MFLTVTPNPSIERTFDISKFERGASHRVPPEDLRVNAGGKGINVARVAARFGVRTQALALVGKNQLAWFDAQLEREAVPHVLAIANADTRVTMNLVHPNGPTEIVEAGALHSIQDGTSLLEKFVESLPNAELVALCGSYPPSQQAGFEMHAALLCQLAAQAGKKLIYDGSGRAFEIAVESKAPPWMVKPNLREAAAFVGRDLASPADERRAVHEFLKCGISVVLLSCGERGAYLGHRNGIEWLEAPPVEAISPVGSGDSLVGAFAAKWLETGDLLEAARWGVAAGSVNAAQLLPAFCQPTEIAALVPKVRVKTREIALSR